MGQIVKEIERAKPELIDQLGEFGVSTIHEAQGRTGLMLPYMRPVFPGTRVVGSAVTVLVAPGDNLTIHVALEHCRRGDIMVVAPTAPSAAGYFGDLLASSFQAHGVRALIIESGVRDVAELQAMRFPVWSKVISAQGTIKETLGSINVQINCAGAIVNPGDVVGADDDGVVIVPRQNVRDVLEASAQRERREGETRKRLKAGELSLDIYGMRGKLASKGAVAARE